MRHLSRRTMLAGAAALPAASALAQPTPAPAPAAPVFGTPPSVVTSPPRQWGPGAPPPFNPDPDIIRVDPAFGGLLVGQETIRRVATGYHLAEGPAWSGIGMYVVFSDVKNDTQY